MSRYYEDKPLEWPEQYEHHLSSGCTNLLISSLEKDLCDEILAVLKFLGSVLIRGSDVFRSVGNAKSGVIVLSLSLSLSLTDFTWIIVLTGF
jgi:hypothetical protein